VWVTNITIKSAASNFVSKLVAVLQKENGLLDPFCSNSGQAADENVTCNQRKLAAH
jgi:hypothetical protein